MTISRCEGDTFIASLEDVVRGAHQRGAFPNRETFQHGVYGTMDARRARSLVLAVPKEGRRAFRTIDHERAGASVGRPSFHTHDAHAARARARLEDVVRDEQARRDRADVCRRDLAAVESSDGAARQGCRSGRIVLAPREPQTSSRAHDEGRHIILAPPAQASATVMDSATASAGSMARFPTRSADEGRHNKRS